MKKKHRNKNTFCFKKLLEKPFALILNESLIKLQGDVTNQTIG